MANQTNNKRNSLRSRIRSTVQAIIDNDVSTVGRIFTVVIQLLIVLSLVAFSIDTLPDPVTVPSDVAVKSAFRRLKSVPLTKYGTPSMVTLPRLASEKSLPVVAN